MKKIKEFIFVEFGDEDEASSTTEDSEPNLLD